MFSNPRNDLDAIRKEAQDLQSTLFAAEFGETIKLDIRRDQSLMDVITSIAMLPGYSASMFHFSGHASQHHLLFPEGEKSILAVCHLLKKAGVRVAFLNGCSTRGFIELIFRETEVKAVLATYTRVKDLVAAELSTTFYKLFIDAGRSLDETFHDLKAGYENYLIRPDCCNMAEENRDIGKYNRAFPNEGSDAFQWGMFYRDPAYRNLTVKTLQGGGESSLELIDRQIVALLEEIVAKDQNMAELLAMSPAAKDSTMYARMKEDRDRLMLQKERLKLQRREMEEKAAEEQRLQEAQALSREMDAAVKKLNYGRQRSAYVSGIKQKFCCFAAIGDGDSLIDLLLVRFRDEYGLHDNRYFPVNIRLGTHSNAGFWPALAEYLNLAATAARANIMTALMKDFFFGGKSAIATSSHQHVFLKVQVNGLSAGSIGRLVKEFWQEVQSFCRESPLFVEPAFSIRHKVVMLLLDDNADAGRETELKNLMDSINVELDTKLVVMPIINPLEKEEIGRWIENNTLDRVGLEPDMAEEIYVQSGKGKIKKVLRCVKDRINITDVDIFKALNI